MSRVLSIENISKKYVIRHQKQGNYLTLRDTLTEGAQALQKRLLGRADRDEQRFEEFWALKDVSFQVNQGDRVGIIGRNGAGKSTLLKVLSRITEPTSGKIKVKGRIASLLEVGTGFHPELTGRENVFLNGAILGMSRAEITRKFDEIVEFAEVAKFLDTPVKRYSSGMYVRLAFAVAAHLEPEILIVDEVLAVGDVQFQKKCLGKMEDVSKDGRTLLFVSHNLASVQSLCNRGVVMKNGQMVLDSSTTEAIRFYSETQGGTSLSIRDRKDRKGNGQAKVVSLTVRDQAGVETDTVGMGEDFSVTLEIEGELKNAIVGILIGNVFIRQICRGYSYESYDHEINVKGTVTVTCSFKDIPLVQGTYNIHTWLGTMGECADEVENAFELNILEKDIFGTGKTLNPNHNMFFVRHDWKFD